MDLKSVTINKLFKQAMKSEKESEKFYKKLEKELNNESAEQLARTLSHMEKGHYNTLEHELEALEKELISRGY